MTLEPSRPSFSAVNPDSNLQLHLTHATSSHHLQLGFLSLRPTTLSFTLTPSRPTSLLSTITSSALSFLLTPPTPVPLAAHCSRPLGICVPHLASIPDSANLTPSCLLPSLFRLPLPALHIVNLPRLFAVLPTASTPARLRPPHLPPARTRRCMLVDPVS